MTTNKQARRESLPCHLERFPFELDHVSGRQLPSPSGLDLAVDPDLAALNQRLGLAARADDTGEFQELVELDR